MRTALGFGGPGRWGFDISRAFDYRKMVIISLQSLPTGAELMNWRVPAFQKGAFYGAQGPWPLPRLCPEGLIKKVT